MNINNFIFPCPAPSYSAQSLISNIVYIPTVNNTKVPCLWIPDFLNGSSRLMIFFHGNGEDIAKVKNLVMKIQD